MLHCAKLTSYQRDTSRREDLDVVQSLQVRVPGTKSKEKETKKDPSAAYPPQSVKVHIHRAFLTGSLEEEVMAES